MIIGEINALFLLYLIPKILNMKTKLLYIACALLIFFTSCSVENDPAELSQSEKELLVQKLFDSFSKSAENSPSYVKFIQTIRSKSSSEWTAEEMQEIEEEFLSKQSAEFLELYYSVISLNLSNEEMITILLKYKDTITIVRSAEDTDTGGNTNDQGGDQDQDQDTDNTIDCHDLSESGYGGSVLAVIFAIFNCD